MTIGGNAALVGVFLGVTGGQISSRKWKAAMKEEADVEIDRWDMPRPVCDLCKEKLSSEDSGFGEICEICGRDPMYYLGLDSSDKNKNVSTTRSMTVDVCVSGWVSSPRSWYRPWGVMECAGEVGDVELEGCLRDFYRVCNEKKLEEDEEDKEENEEGKEEGGGEESGGHKVDEGDGEEKEDNAEGEEEEGKEKKEKEEKKEEKKSKFIPDLLTVWSGRIPLLLNSIFEKYNVNPLNMTSHLLSGSPPSTEVVSLSVSKDGVDAIDALGFTNYSSFVEAVVPAGNVIMKVRAGAG